MKGLNYVIAGLETASLKIDESSAGRERGRENSHTLHSGRMTGTFRRVFDLCVATLSKSRTLEWYFDLLTMPQTCVSTHGWSWDERLFWGGLMWEGWLNLGDFLCVTLKLFCLPQILKSNNNKTQGFYCCGRHWALDWSGLNICSLDAKNLLLAFSTHTP